MQTRAQPDEPAARRRLHIFFHPDCDRRLWLRTRSADPAGCCRQALRARRLRDLPPVGNSAALDVVSILRSTAHDMPAMPGLQGRTLPGAGAPDGPAEPRIHRRRGGNAPARSATASWHRRAHRAAPGRPPAPCPGRCRRRRSRHPAAPIPRSSAASSCSACCTWRRRAVSRASRPSQHANTPLRSQPSISSPK